MENLPSTRSEAQASGYRFFFPGTECTRGHVAPRYTINRLCKECSLERAREARATNPERNRAAVAKWKKNNPDKVKAQIENSKEARQRATKAWRQRNPEKVLEAVRRRRERDREPSRRAALAWQKRNPIKKAALNGKRRADQSQATPRWLTKSQMEEIQAFYSEASRLSFETGVPHQVDHIEPLRGKASCGLHVPWNLQVLTAEANAKKGNTLI